MERAHREQRPLTLALLDIDYFKQINDTHGHKGGDLMLQAVASLLTAHTRSGDAVCRYGGEEFVLILPGASPATAQRRMNELCAHIAALTVPFKQNTMQTTASIGLAGFPQHGRTEDELLHSADEALYRAKNSGRNRVVALE
jgi:diguanylate cyclase (GGDEF)-like protein